MLRAKLSSKFQVSIPKAIRENLALQPGQQFVLVERSHIIELVPVQSVKQARGMLSDIGTDSEMDYRDRNERTPP